MSSYPHHTYFKPDSDPTEEHQNNYHLYLFKSNNANKEIPSSVDSVLADKVDTQEIICNDDVKEPPK